MHVVESGTIGIACQAVQILREYPQSFNWLVQYHVMPIIPVAVWIGILATLPVLSGSPWTEPYADLIPLEPMYIATPAALPVAILLSAPAGVTKYRGRLFAWKSGMTVRVVLGTLLLLVMGSLTAGDILLVAAVSAVASAAPFPVRGWRVSNRDTALHLLAGLVLVPISYAYMPYAVPVLLALIMSILVAAGLVAPRTEKPIEMPPGFDWRNTPNEKHPGEDMCSCPRHRNRRENPGILQLCADCMEVYMKRPTGVRLTRRVRVVLWLIRNVSVRYMELRLVSNADDCHFCGSRRGGLRGRAMPPPDAR